MTDPSKLKRFFPSRIPGTPRPEKSGNSTIVRKCADEILAMKESSLGFDRKAICQLLATIFQRSPDLITPLRLSTNLAIVVKGDDEQERQARALRVLNLKDDLDQILKNLWAKSALYHNNPDLLLQATPSVRTAYAIAPAESIVERRIVAPSQAPAQVKNASRSAASSTQPAKPTVITENPAVENQDGKITMPSKAPAHIQKMHDDFSRITGIQLELKQRIALLNHIRENYARLIEYQLKQPKGDRTWQIELTDFSNNLK